MFAAFTRIRSPHCSGEEKQTSNFLYRLAGIAESEAVRGNVARRTVHLRGIFPFRFSYIQIIVPAAEGVLPPERFRCAPLMLLRCAHQHHPLTAAGG